MTSNSDTIAVEGVEGYPSLSALRDAHGALLEQRRASGDTPELLASAGLFIQRGAATGALLDESEDRRAAQSLLNYWANMLYRAGRGPLDGTLVEFDPLLAPALPDELCPYLGLDAFGESNAARFFGRQELVARTLDRLHEQRLLAVVGPSGSGKSSVVRAGLLPALCNGALPASESWHYLPPLLPGSDPIDSLARALSVWSAALKPGDAPSRPDGDGGLSAVSAGAALATATTIASYAALLRQDGAALVRLLGTAAPAPAVLVVDQFEEVFTLCEDVPTRQAFLANLLALASAPEPAHRVILTMRSDFETFVARVPELQPLFERGRVQVTPLSAAELREAIEAPAAQVGLKFEPGVVDLLLQDILGEPAGLPLLQFTLLKLWEQRERNRVTRAAYERVGGGRLALARSADAFYRGLIPEEQVTARRMLLRMVRPGEGLEITSSRVRRTTLAQSGEDPGRVERVLGRLVDARLVRLTSGETPEDDQVEVAHEALVRNWPALVDWLEEEKAAIATRRRLESRAADWVRLGRSEAGLLDAVEWREAERWLQSAEAQYLGYDPALPALIAASRAATERAEREQEAARQRELEQAHALAEVQRTLAEAQARTARRLRRAAIALLILLSVALFAAGYAFVQQSQATYQQHLAQTAEVQALSDANLRATAQAQVQDQSNLVQTAEAQAQLQRQSAEQKSVALATAQAQVQSQLISAQLAFAARGQIQDTSETALLLAYEAVLHDHNTVSEQALRDVMERVLGNVTPLIGHSARVSNVVFSPDGQRILTASDDSTARLWDLSGKLLATLQGHTINVKSAVFSPDGQRIVTASADKTARLWDLSGKELVVFKGHTNPLNGALFSPDGKYVLTASEDTSARLWDLSGKQLAIFGHPERVVTAVFSPDGRNILTSSYDDKVRLWNLSGKQIAIFAHNNNAYSAVFSPDSQRILTASEDQTARLWDLSGKQLAILQHTSAVLSAIFSPNGQRILTESGRAVHLWDLSGKRLAILTGNQGVFSPDGQQVLTGSDNGVAQLWDLSGKQLAVLQGHTGSVTSVAFSPNGQAVLTASEDYTARLWDLVGKELATFHSSVRDFSPDGHQVLIASGDGTIQRQDLMGAIFATYEGDSAVFSPDGRYILIGLTHDDTARLWSLDGKLLGTFKGFGESFSPNGQYFLTGSYKDDRVRLWDINGKQIAVFRGSGAIFSPDGQRILTRSSEEHASQLWDLSGKKLADFKFAGLLFSPDGQQVLSAAEDSGDYGAHLWSVSGQNLAHFRHNSFVTSAVFSANGAQILTASQDKTARLWDVSGKQLVVFSGHSGSIWSAVFSPDGQRVLTASDDGTARLWDVSGHQFAVFKGSGAPLYQAIFSPDGRRILTTSEDKVVRQYLVNIDDLLTVAACRVGRGLTDEEIAHFQVPTPLKFDFAKRQCPPALGGVTAP